eukprot:scaffold87057_cov24-Tisochrysis_lutea.AAC.6
MAAANSERSPVEDEDSRCSCARCAGGKGRATCWVHIAAAILARRANRDWVLHLLAALSWRLWTPRLCDAVSTWPRPPLPISERVLARQPILLHGALTRPQQPLAAASATQPPPRAPPLHPPIGSPFRRPLSSRGLHTPQTRRAIGQAFFRQPRHLSLSSQSTGLTRRDHRHHVAGDTLQRD